MEHAILPPELALFIEFVTDDERPTLLLERHNKKLVFRNVAFEDLIRKAELEKELESWIRKDVPGVFAGRRWTGKKVGKGGRWVAVICEEERGTGQCQGRESRQRERLLDNTPTAEPARARSRDQRDNNDLKKENGIADDILERPQPDQDTKPELTDMIVDWLNFPHLTPDPWVHAMRAHDWENTAIGPMQNWHPALHQIYVAILSSTEPRVLYWGNDLTMFYNEAARFLVGDMHPAPLGNPLASVWGVPMRDQLCDILTTGVKQGKPLHNKRRELMITRNGVVESAFFDFVFIPLPDSNGRFLGFVNKFHEITTSVVQENRYEVSKTILENASKSADIIGLWKGFVDALEGKSMDVSYALVYCAAKKIDLTSTSSADTPTVPGLQEFGLRANFGIHGCAAGSTMSNALVNGIQNQADELLILQQANGTLPVELAVDVPGIGLVNTACVLPIPGTNNQPVAYVVLGINATRPWDENSHQFVSSLRDLLFKSAVLFSLPIEQRRIQEITSSLTQQLQSATLKAEKSEMNFTRMVQDAPIGMCMHRRDGYPVYVNDAYLELLGMTRAAFYEAAKSGFAWRDAIFKEDADLIANNWTAAMEEKKPFHIEFRVNTPAKSSHSPNRGRWLEVATQLRFDEQGNTVFLYGWLMDITSRKLSESLVSERLQDALETKRSSENFIDMVSHEMRNPLSSILQLTDSIMMTVPEEEESTTLTADSRASIIDAAQTITLCAKHQKNIIDEVLTFSKLDSKLLVLALERAQPPMIVESALKMVKAELEHADIQGSIEIAPSYTKLAVDYVLVDPGRLLQVIINLLTNAIKFTQNCPQRNITVVLDATRTRPSKEDTKVTLIDPRRTESEDDAQAQAISSYTGPIGEEIFICFNVRDTGVGLTDEEMKHLFHRFAQASPKTYKQYGGSGLGLFISRELTELQGGQIGVYSESGLGSQFSFYVKALRVEPPSKLESVPPRLHNRSPGLTSPRPSFPATPTTNGLMGVPKSIPAQASKHEVLVPNNVANSENTATIVEIQELHVLVVEDNAINQKVMAQQLRKFGCATVSVADHGLDALNFLSNTTFMAPTVSHTGESQIPLSVVLLDVEMPVMDGLTCVRRIRGLQKEGMMRKGVHVPVIGITANARTEQVAACIEAGMDEVITKPFRIHQLVPRMQSLVSRHLGQKIGYKDEVTGV